MTKIIDPIHCAATRGAMMAAMTTHKSMIGDIMLIKITDPSKSVERAADALRLHEMKGRVTLTWDRISAAQKRRWLEKAKIVLDAASPPGS